ncbi:MAG: XRE family transcriptional regulator [Candidatus Angelobacter sp. Gp1-AA117]|nr:MAG: XRE family transcriptional regulator [Candidatus Angelobacter sp. Gp1-AA117]
MEKINKQVGKQIHVLRQRQGISQEELADICGLHRSHLGQIERGELNVTVVTVQRIGRGLGVSLNQILGSIGGKA